MPTAGPTTRVLAGIRWEPKTSTRPWTFLRELDLVQAVERHLADPAILDNVVDNRLALADGVQIYRDHVGRSPVTGGAGKSTQKRYRAIFDKFQPFATGLGVRFWNDISVRHLDQYAGWLDGEGYAYRTTYIELTTIKQAMNYLIESGHLPETCRIHLKLSKMMGTDTYCWRQEEVQAIIQYCRAAPELGWLGDVLTALSCTGMRISELANLRFTDIDFGANVVKLTDETAKAVRSTGRQVRQLKSRRSRSFPIHADLLPVLEGIERHRDGRVFHGPLGGVIKPDIVRRADQGPHAFGREVLDARGRDRFQGRPAPFVPSLFLLRLRQYWRAGAGGHAVAGPPRQSDGAALLPSARRGGPAADAESQFRGKLPRQGGDGGYHAGFVKEVNRDGFPRRLG